MAATSAGRLSSPARTPPAVRSRLAGLPRRGRYTSLLRWCRDSGRLTSPAAAARTVTTVARRRRRTTLLDAAAGRGRAVLGAPRRGPGRLGRGGPARGLRPRRAAPRRRRGGRTYTADLDVDDDLGVPGLRARCVFASIAFDPAAGTSVFVVPEVVVGRRDGVTLGDHRRRRRPGALAAARICRTTDPRPGCATPTARSTRPAGARRSPPRCSGSRPATWPRSCSPATCSCPPTRPLDPRRLLRRLAARFPDCWTFAVDGLLGATPELLLRRTGRELSARVLAGTAPARGRRRGRAAGRGAARLGQGPRRARARRRLPRPRAATRTARELSAPGRAASCSRWPTSGTWPPTSPAPSGAAAPRGAGRAARADRRGAPDGGGLRHADRRGRPR